MVCPKEQSKQEEDNHRTKVEWPDWETCVGRFLSHTEQMFSDFMLILFTNREVKSSYN